MSVSTLFSVSTLYSSTKSDAHVLLGPMSKSEKNAFKVLCSGVHVLAGERAFLFSKNVCTGSEAHLSPLFNCCLRKSDLGAEIRMSRAIH